MTIYAPNEVVAKSRYWYFLSQLHKVKKTAGEIVSITHVRTSCVQRDCVVLSLCCLVFALCLQCVAMMIENSSFLTMQWRSICG